MRGHAFISLTVFDLSEKVIVGVLTNGKDTHDRL